MTDRRSTASRTRRQAPRLARNTRHATGTWTSILAVLAVLLSHSSAHAQETLEYYGADSLGSIRVVFDQSGGVLARTEYMPFGDEVFALGSMPNERFAGSARDGYSGMDYAYARMHLPRLGRFQTIDPVGASPFLPQQWNRYTYAENSPTNLIDPTGMLAQGPAGPCPPEAEFCVDGDPDDDDDGFTGGVIVWPHQFPGDPSRPNGTAGNGDTGTSVECMMAIGGAGCGEPPPPSAIPPASPPRERTPPRVERGGDTAEGGKEGTVTEGCFSRWSFGNTLSNLLGLGPAGRTVVNIFEVGGPLSLYGDVRAIVAKGGGLLGTRNLYASGINRGLRRVGIVKPVIGDIASPVLAVTGAFTGAYNATIELQCLVGVLE